MDNTNNTNNAANNEDQAPNENYPPNENPNSNERPYTHRAPNENHPPNENAANNEYPGTPNPNAHHTPNENPNPGPHTHPAPNENPPPNTPFERPHTPTLIFLLATKNGAPVFLHPLSEEHSLRSSMELEGRYGIPPQAEASVLVRNVLNEEADREISEWLAERNFLPRFALALLAFFVSFFIMAWVIRDPIPLIDEILISSGIAVATYLGLAKKSRSSLVAVAEKIRLNKKIDTIQFTQKEYLRQLENMFQNIHERSGRVYWTEDADHYRLLQQEVQKHKLESEIEQLRNCAQRHMYEESRNAAKRSKIFTKQLSEGQFPAGSSACEELYILSQAVLMNFQAPNHEKQQNS